MTLMKLHFHFVFFLKTSDCLRLRIPNENKYLDNVHDTLIINDILYSHNYFVFFKFFNYTIGIRIEYYSY